MIIETEIESTLKSNRHVISQVKNEQNGRFVCFCFIQCSILP